MEQRTVSIIKISGDRQEAREDIVAVEARFELRINGEAAFSFPCTPADLEDMAIGALFTRGYIRFAEQVASLAVADGCIDVVLQDCEPAAAVNSERPELAAEQMFRAAEEVFSDPETLFNRTGCAHSCALFHAGEIVCVREDIGRHNALDKVIGFALRQGVPAAECVIFTSGRISGDYMSKLICAGFPVAVSRAAVTDEAVDLAKTAGVKLYGFVRGGRANLYTE